MKNPIQYIICDPAKLLPIPTWLDCCKLLYEYDKKNICQKFKEKVAQALTDFTGYQAYVCEVGGQTWSNTLIGEKIVKPDFTSESGFVCVSRITWKGLNCLYNKGGEENALLDVAIINMSENIKVDFDTSNPQWTVIQIQDNISGHKVSSLEKSFYEECDEPNQPKQYLS